MRYLLLLVTLLPLFAQDPAGQAKPAEAAKPAEQAKPAAEAPASASESWLTGSADFGYRWRTDVGGSAEAYRSIADYGEGPSVPNFDFLIHNPSRRVLDRAHVLANGWGADPYSLVRVGVQKTAAYRFHLDYRNLAYFNFLPSYANPLIEQGVFLNQRSYSTRRRLMDTGIELFPGRRIAPYFSYSRNSGGGTGISTYVSAGNEYAVRARLDDRTDNYRGGVRLEMNRWHVTLEQGGTKFEDGQELTNAGTAPGNRLTPYLGQMLRLDNLLESYGVRGDSFYSSALLTAAPASWVDVHGQFRYSRPQTDVKYSASAAGLFVLLGANRFYTGEQASLTGDASLPHTTGNAGFLMRPVRRVRIVESWGTDRFHTASSAVLAEQLLFAPNVTQSLGGLLADRLEYSYSRQQAEVMVDAAKGVTLRGGHRYVWGDAKVRAAQLTGRDFSRGELRRHVALAGATLRPFGKLSVTANYEGSPGDQSYFRTSLQNYHRGWVRARYEMMPSLLVSGTFSALDNRNSGAVTPAGARPASAFAAEAPSEYEFFSRAGSFTVQWLPQGARRVSLLGEYTRSSIRSDISYLAPFNLSRERSFYRENAHAVTGLLDLNLPAVRSQTPRISLGGSMYLSSGSRPADYYQPLTRVFLPVHKHAGFFGEWRWYGYSEPFFLYEGFRAHIFLTGLRITM